jgi:hypothetical protein
MVETGHGEWFDEKKQKIFIYWKSPTEWFSNFNSKLFRAGFSLFLLKTF